MTGLPIDIDPALNAAAQIAQKLGQGVAMLQNPIDISGITSIAGSALGTVGSAIANATTLPVEVVSKLSSLGGVFSDVIDQGSALFEHAEKLIFGGGSGLLSGGLASNYSQAMSALNLDDTMARLGGGSRGSVDNPCQVVRDFFGSILGAGQALIAQAAALLAQARAIAEQALGAIMAAVGAGIEFINSAIAQALALIEPIVAAIQAKINEIAGLIAGELSRFAEWMAKQLNFGFASFIAAINSNPCFALVKDVVATPELNAILGTLA